MENPRFVVPVADLELGPKELEWELPTEWLAGALEASEAAPRGARGRLRATLTKNGKEVVVLGHVQAALTMPCARTLAPTDVDVDAELYLLLAPAVAAEERARKGRARKSKKALPAGRERGDAHESLSGEDAAGDTYDGERVVLDPFVREFILLELPMFPLHSEDSRAIRPTVAASETTEKPIDPRLAPLAALKSRLENKEE